jgi:hypothetical protein
VTSSGEGKDRRGKKVVKRKKRKKKEQQNTEIRRVRLVGYRGLRLKRESRAREKRW